MKGAYILMGLIFAALASTAFACTTTTTSSTTVSTSTTTIQPPPSAMPMKQQYQSGGITAGQGDFVGECIFKNMGMYHGLVGGLSIKYWNTSSQTVWIYLCNGGVSWNSGETLQ